MNRILSFIGTDGMLHITCSALIVLECRRWGLPRWAAACVGLGAGVAKEVYDKVSGRGSAEWKDLGCDLVGVVLGMV